MVQKIKANVAVLVCTNVIGGHEFQAATLVRDLLQHAAVTVYLNHEAHRPMFAETGAHTVVLPGKLLRTGNLLRQVKDGLAARTSLRRLLGTPDMVLVSAGAVEAGIAASIALRGWMPLSLYLPFFYDRVPTWGRVGHLYNCVLARFCGLYQKIVTINRIQATVIRAITGTATVVVPNLVRPVIPAPATQSGRMLFVGRVDHQKRIDELIEWTDFAENPFKQLVIVGDGPLRNKIESMAAVTRHIEVKLVGWLSPQQQDTLIDGNDVLLLNSLLEGEPLVIREANKRGMRVFARAITGVRGVTRRSTRFSTQEELRALLRSEDSCRGPVATSRNVDDLGRRNRAIGRLVANIAPVTTV